MSRFLFVARLKPHAPAPTPQERNVQFNMYGTSKAELFSEGMQEITGCLHSIFKANHIYLYIDNSYVSVFKNGQRGICTLLDITV